MIDQNQLIELRETIARDGVRPALAKLNALSPFRFIGLYIFPSDIAQVVHFYDRENPSILLAEEFRDLPITVTYCVYVRDTRSPFVIEDALRADFLATHPARKKIRAYCGVPLEDWNGNTFGSMCLFDYRPRVTDDSLLDLMQALAPAFQSELLKK